MVDPERSCPVSVLWDPRFLEYDFGPAHPFTERSRASAVELLERSGFFDGDRRREAAFDPAPADRLARFHDGSYLARVRRASSSSHRTLLDAGDTPGFPGCYEAAARLVAGTLRGLEIVREEPGRHAFQPGGGLHHAHPDAASGFCIFNDVALLVASALGSGAFQRVAYIDIDVHHGDGVMYGFFRDGRVLDIDFHQDGRTLFPGTGEVGEIGVGDGAGCKVNVPLPPGAGDREFLPAFRRVVPALLREYRPELIVLQTGVDGHAGDPLAQLALSSVSYVEAIGTVHRLAHELAGGRLVETGGGGYAAANVARILARAGYLLAGRAEPPTAGGRLPETWRAGFAREFATEAPLGWETEGPPSSSSAVKEQTDEVLGRLERALGRPLRADSPDDVGSGSARGSR